MGKFVDQQDGGVTRERGIEIEFAPHDAAVAHRQARQLRKVFQQRFGFGSAVQFHIADDHIRTGSTRAASRLQHRIGLAHAGGGAKEYLQTPA